MHVVVEVISGGLDRPPSGAQVIVQVRDTSRMDTRADIISEQRSTTGTNRDRIALVEFEVPDGTANATVWALVDVDGDGQVSRGDYLTVQSFPLRDRQQVSVKKVP